MTIPHPLPRSGSRATLVASVPYMIGFQPADALVVVGADTDSALAAECLPTPPPDTHPRDVLDAVRDMVTSVQHDGVDRLVLMNFAGTGGDVLARLASIAARDRQLPVEAVLHVDADRFRCDCPATGCPDRNGTTIPSGVVRAMAAAAPFRPAANLEELTAHVTPSTTRNAGMIIPWILAGQRLARYLTRTATGDGTPVLNDAAVPAAAESAITAAYTAQHRGDPLTDDEAAWLGLLLTRQSVRDRLHAGIADRPEHLAVWCALTRHTDADAAAGPAVGAAIAAGLLHHGGLARLAVNVALAAEPGNAVARQLSGILRSRQPRAATAALQQRLRGLAGTTAPGHADGTCGGDR